MKFLLLLIFTISLSALDKPNVLFIAVDDLRPDLGCYGVEHVKTPHMDKLGNEGTVFLNAYCNVPVCGASRASIMTSIRPIAGKRFMSHMSQADKEAPGIKTLHALFKENGYTTISNGKILHMKEDSEAGWSEKPWHDIEYSRQNWASTNFDALWKLPASKLNLSPRGRGPYREAADVPDSEHQDGKVADKTISDLKKLKESDKPFFLACGFWRPHLPFNAPKKYFDMYDKDKLPSPADPIAVKNLPGGCKSSGELNAYSEVKGRLGSKEFEREARWSYYACVSYVDAQIGRVLNELKNLGLDKNTIVVLWGDHGYHLGEHKFWGKHNTLDYSTRVPLILRVPGLANGQKLSQLAEFVDIYPTLCDLTGLELPAHVQGESLTAVMKNPSLSGKDAVFIEWRNCYTIKTRQYAFTQFFNKKGDSESMLFDHISDSGETENIADRADMKEVIKVLKSTLEKHRKGIQ